MSAVERPEVMANKVVTIRGGEIDEGTGVDVTVVGILEKALEAAKRGDFTAVAVIWVGHATNVDHDFSRGYGRHQLIAGTVYLQHDLAQ